MKPEQIETERDAVFANMVATLAKPGEAIKYEISPQQAHAWHMVTGIAGEAGELVDAIKKNVIYRKVLDTTNLVEELGDMEFYLEGLRQAYGITRNEVLAANVAKLSKRYGEALQYSDRAAQLRADKS